MGEPVSDARARPVELTDLLAVSDPVTGGRRPVRVDEATEVLQRAGQRRAVRILQRLPQRDGVLAPAAVDELLLRVHLELQRLGEELQLPRRLGAWVEQQARDAGATSEDPLTVVDVGCGLGHAVRWLAAHGTLGRRVRLVGVDHDAALVAHASRLAVAESLDCSFVVGDAFGPGVGTDRPDRTVVVSSGLLHHLDPGGLAPFFAAHEALGVRAFAHWDAAPGPWTTVGALVFHLARMREAVSRHDGVLSVRRAYPADELLAAAREGAPRYEPTCSDVARHRPLSSEVLRPVTGRRR